MLKVVAKTLIGLLFTFGGLYLAYFYMSGIDMGRSGFLLIPAITLIVVGTVLLFQAGKSDVTVLVKADGRSRDQSTITRTSPINTLTRNNNLVAQWRKTTAQRDRLKMLELSGKVD
jgi:hypothetical protein